MRKSLEKLGRLGELGGLGGIILAVLFLLFFSLNLVFSTFAQYSPPKGTSDIRVSASVGQLYLSVSGFASPYASIILKTSDGMLRSTVADENGNFFISQVLIKKGLSHFCLSHVDFKRIGESEACVDISPAKENVIINNIFLPPTVGLSRKQIKEGEEVTIFGYSMPNSVVVVYISKKQKITVNTDSTGFYSYVLKDTKAGEYSLVASAYYKKQNSLPNVKGVQLKVLSISGQVKETAKNVWQYLTSSGMVILLISFILLILIIIVILRLHPEILDWIKEKLKITHKMHHDWFLDDLH